MLLTYVLAFNIYIHYFIF